MQTLLPVLAMLGGALMMFAGAMLVPLAFSFFGGDAALYAWDGAIAITFLSGLALFLLGRRVRRELQPRDGLLLVSSVWTVLPLFGALPLLFHIEGLSFTDAYFEAVSGLTTTGATVLTGLEHLPLSINVWRCLMMFIGGMGILVLAVAILPMLGVGGSQLFRAETPGPMKDQKLTPRIAHTARGLWSIYFGMSLACFLAYRLAGMGWADAFMHMCTTVSLGGFAAYDASFGAFDSAAIEIVATVFMMLAGVNFALYFMVWRRRSLRALLCDVEARLFLGLLVSATLVLTLFLMSHRVYADFGETLRHTVFHVVSIATTTGYATRDYALWPAFGPLLLLFLSCFTSCAGSTGGGIKLVRSLLLMKCAQREFKRIVHPRAVAPVTLGGAAVDANVLQSVLAFMLVYGAVMVLATLLLLFSGLEPVTAFTAALASINNLGPGLGVVGPAGNFQPLSDFQVWVCTVAMLLGRLELFSLLVLFTGSFWRK
ncbi:TrkH family potassium uptake protein [Azohydromonas aeria]|uniref:TrkH family potassium uptake protein n=1 Tax=Azohydromonas aeria TaxID=2590212 RepID=UPI0012F7894D|nr:potassium transporter TrkG [Azohydromonas aeria]